MTTKQIPTKQTLGADVGRFIIGAVFVVMTMAFLMVPYALSSNPGDTAPQLATAAARHLS
jgi:hypothetical protein